MLAKPWPGSVTISNATGHVSFECLIGDCSTWTQVIGPELIGQAVDCYLSQPAVTTLGNFPGAENFRNTAEHNCWYEAQTTPLSSEQRLAGLGGLILRIIGLYVVGAVLTGMTFLVMAWIGRMSCALYAWMFSITCISFPWAITPKMKRAI